jgi:transcriptional regulator
MDLLVLQVVAQHPLHGYAIGQHIEQLTDDVLQIEQGSLYPALYRLERNGWLKSSWRKTDTNRKAKFYELTAQGRRHLEEEVETWTTFAEAVSRVLPGG